MKNLIKEIPAIKFFLIANIINILLTVFSMGNNTGSNTTAYKAGTIFSEESSVFQLSKETTKSGYSLIRGSKEIYSKMKPEM